MNQLSEKIIELCEKGYSIEFRFSAQMDAIIVTAKHSNLACDKAVSRFELQESRLSPDSIFSALIDDTVHLIEGKK